MEKVDSLQEQMGTVEIVMEIIRNNQKIMLEIKKANKKKGLCWAHQSTRHRQGSNQ